MAETLKVSRSSLVDQLRGKAKARRRNHEAQDGERRRPQAKERRERGAAHHRTRRGAADLWLPAELPVVAPLVRATPGDAYLNRQLRSQGLAPVNHKRTCRIMKTHNLLLARKYSERPEHIHDGKVIVMRSNLRWCSDGSSSLGSERRHRPWRLHH